MKNTELQNKILALLEYRHINDQGPLLLAGVAAAVCEDKRKVANALDSMRNKHQVTHKTNVGWTITGVGRRVVSNYAPAPKASPGKPRLTKPAAAPEPAPVPTRKTNHVALVVDRSGSMDSCQTAARNAVNAQVRELQRQAAATGQETTLTHVQFDTYVEVTCAGKPIGLVEPNLPLEPRNMTALYDAVGEAIERLKGLPVVGDTSYLAIVVTDGQENQSRKYNEGKLVALMREVQSTDRWTLAFLVPNEFARKQLVAAGIPADNVRIWEATSAGAKVMEEKLSGGIGHYYATRSAGQTSTRSFFQPDLSKVKPEDIAKLTDIRGQCYLWSIDQETVIQPFVEAKLGFYKPGQGYYPLTKRETVQPFKQVALLDRKSGAIYAGTDARQLLGLPNYELKIEPGNHAGYEIFIQSTSNNRKLVRGSKLLYLK